MQPDPEIPASNASPAAKISPPPVPTSEPPVLGASPPLAAGSPPPLRPNLNSGRARKVIATLLGLCLGLFLADGIISFVDDSLIVLFGAHVLAPVRGMVALLALLMGFVIYCMMGFAPMIPKRLFLPVTLFTLAAGLVAVPLTVYFYSRIQQVACAISFCQLAVGLGILYLVQGGSKFGWPLVPEERLGSKRFSWLNLTGFVLGNVFALLPAVIVYLVLCAGLAISHFSDGFLALRPGGLTVQVRKYSRDDGKTIQLFPMAHVGDAASKSKSSSRTGELWCGPTWTWNSLPRTRLISSIW